MATEVLETRYRAVTPMFCGGAQPARPELRLTSFKGVLRWWWRALAWPRYGGDLEKIRHTEEMLFGSSKAGQSHVVMRLHNAVKREQLEAGKILRSDGGVIVGEGARYLGYGIMEAFASKARGSEAGQLTRGCLLAPFDFTVEMRCRNLDESLRIGLEEALRALGLLGGIGSKNRKGYGSLALTELKLNGASVFSAPTTIGELKEAVAGLYARSGIGTTPFGSNGAPPLPQYTALSERARTILLSAGNARDPLVLLDRVGREMVRYRSWGHNGTVLHNIPREHNFRDDHDLMKLPPAQRPTHPRRIVFGLPHNYYFSGARQTEQVGAEGYDRRASPLLIHIHQCGATPVAVLSFLPAQFLPPSVRIDVGGKKVGLVADPLLWQPIEDFLDRLLDPTRRKERFDATAAVRP
jgi:CRISPR-associated protein Cmr1